MSILLIAFQRKNHFQLAHPKRQDCFVVSVEHVFTSDSSFPNKKFTIFSLSIFMNDIQSDNNIPLTALCYVNQLLRHIHFYFTIKRIERFMQQQKLVDISITSRSADRAEKRKEIEIELTFENNASRKRNFLFFSSALFAMYEMCASFKWTSNSPTSFQMNANWIFYLIQFQFAFFECKGADKKRRIYEEMNQSFAMC